MFAAIVVSKTVHDVTCFRLFIVCLSLFAVKLRAYDIQAMSLEEKVGQLLMVHFIGEEVNDDARKLVQQAHVGGIIYFRTANGLTSPDQVRRLSRSLQDLARIPVFIAIDAEGGPVCHLKHGFTLFPSAWSQGRTGDAHLAQQVAFASSQELKAVGINMNLAPVVDINTNPANPVIGIRSFGSSAEVVARFGRAALDGYKEGGIIAALKHFPGHGDVATDSHTGLPVTNKPLDQLEKEDLYPFGQLAKEADVIMSAHLLVPSIDPDACATFSSRLLQGVLRQKLGFKGVIISDSLLMDGALMQAKSVENAAINAFNAGCDLLIIAGGFSKKTLTTADSMCSVHKALVDAVRDGRISLDKLHTSLERILHLKEKHALKLQTTSALKTAEHLALCNQIAKKSVEIIYNHLPADFIAKTLAIIAPEALTVELSQTQMAAKASKIMYYKTCQPSPEAILEAQEMAKSADVIIVLTAYNQKFPGQADLSKQLVQSGKKVILFSIGLPQDAHVHPVCSALVATYSPTPAALDAAFSLLAP